MKTFMAAGHDPSLAMLFYTPYQHQQRCWMEGDTGINANNLMENPCRKIVRGAEWKETQGISANKKPDAEFLQEDCERADG